MILRWTWLGQMSLSEQSTAGSIYHTYSPSQQWKSVIHRTLDEIMVETPLQHQEQALGDVVLSCLWYLFNISSYIHQPAKPRHQPAKPRTSTCQALCANTREDDYLTRWGSTANGEYIWLEFPKRWFLTWIMATLLHSLQSLALTSWHSCPSYIM